MIAPTSLAGGLIALAVTVGIARLLRREAPWPRVALLAGLSIAAGALQFLTLFPPPVPFARGKMVVATAGAPRDLMPAAGERLVALPEAPALAAAERVPDLATALRRHGRPARLRVVGAGLTARDRPAARGIALAFRPPPLPRGLAGLTPPPATAAGSAFAVAARTSGLAGGSAELLDPAGRRVDARAIGRDGHVTLVGSARAPGLAPFTLRLRDAKRAVVSATAVPVWTVPDPAPRVLVIGAPGPETKYLRRWATDAGIALTSRLDAGGGVALGDAPVALTAATLDRYDALVIDDRAWSGLGVGRRAAVTGAVARGLGVIVRMTGAASATSRREWAALGLAVADGERRLPVALAPLAIDADALAAQRPAADPEQGDAAALDDPAPDLGRWDIRAGPDLVPLLRDDAGGWLAAWRQRGLGRAAIWTLADGYALVLAGQRERYFQWWSDAVSTVARARPQFEPQLAPALPRAGTRTTICGVSGAPRIIAPDGRETRLVIPVGDICAAYWPTVAGPHRLLQPQGNTVAVRPFYVYEASEIAAAVAAELADATAALVTDTSAAAVIAIDEHPGPAWPWFLGWLAVSALLWWLERRPLPNAR